MMSGTIRLILLFWMLIFSSASFAQLSNVRSVKFAMSQDTVKLDSLSIYPGSFELFCGETKLMSSDYVLNYAASEIFIVHPCSKDFRAVFRVLPFDLSKTYMSRDTSLLYVKEKGMRDQFLIKNNVSQEDVFGGSSVSKSGSISRGVSFGNNQDLGVNSTLNLELSGQIAPNLKLLASVSDDNLPIQPDGNTNKLQEFDQVFIQVYNDRFKMIAGDFWLYKPTGYFMTYKKRAQGLTFDYLWNEDTLRRLNTQVSGALSKGKFQRQIIQGIEGNQGPYRLIGSENEPFIIVLAGTERVYIDGKLLDRGQEFDYVVDYNSSEVTFTARHQITKDSRIVIEFQYSDQNYLRTLIQSATTYETEKVKLWFNLYSEQDAKNQTIQQPLSLSQKKLLSEIGDTLSLARTSSIDSVGFFENQNLYKLIDSLGFDSVLVHSVDVDSAIYRATFEFVGQGNGDYILNNYNALGKVFKWVEPIFGVPQGDYAPSRLIVTPKQRQMVSGGMRLKIGHRTFLESELAYSKNDVNTFSRYDSKDDQSAAGRFKLVSDLPLGRDTLAKWLMRTKVEMEARDQNFNHIEQYRSVEFDRDWNTRNKNYLGHQLASSLGTDFRHKYGNINIEGQQFAIGTDYFGIRGATDGKWRQKGFSANWDGSYLSSDAENKNEFLRHRSEFAQSIGWFKIGYKDDHERNVFQTDLLSLSSYEFFDYQFYIANSDSVKNLYKIFYRERYDWRSDSTQLIKAAKARSVGTEVAFLEMKDQQLKLVSSYRELKIIDTNLLNIAPENTLLGRIEYELRTWGGAFTLNSFYEVGSGLELKREFLYIQVNDGQGVYAWIDYNGDGIKDLNEFEIAQFVDQASYIRVFTPSNEYLKTYSNEFNQSIQIRPERHWAKKKGFLKFAGRFSDQARVRINRKTNLFDVNDAFNPFATGIADSNLISTNSNVRNTLYFNRTSSIAGGEYSYQNVRSKSLLASGFDSRSNAFHEIVFRWNIMQQFTLKMTGRVGDKSSEADYTSGRNFNLHFVFLEPSFIYQPNTVFRVTIDARGSEKKNHIDLGGEVATVLELGTTFKYNQKEKGSLQGGFKVINIQYNGIQNSALGFEMLEALRPGVNYTWNMGYQRSISRSLQLSIQYNGRKSEENKMIHSGGMELRAFF